MVQEKISCLFSDFAYFWYIMDYLSPESLAFVCMVNNMCMVQA